MRSEIKWRQKQLGITTLYVTHDQIEAMSMADRVAILDQGKIRQVGTPMEIYSQPANIFVANFIGSPSMNLIPCELSANGNTIFAQLIGRLKISIPQESISRNASNREVWLGIHPENLVVYKNETVGTLAVEVHNFEELGVETIVDLNLGLDEQDKNVILKARIPPDQTVQLGQTVWMGIEACSIFDKRTGDAI